MSQTAKTDAQHPHDVPAELAPDAAARMPGADTGDAFPAEGRMRLIRGGDRVSIRPLHARDAEMERRFIEDLSPASRRFRFLDSMKSPSEALLRKLTVLDPGTDIAFVAVTVAGPKEHQVGVGRFSAASDGKDCEFAITVADQWQNKGLGTLLMAHLIEAARERGIERMHSSDAWDNDLMRRFAAHVGLRHAPDPDDAAQILYTLELRPAVASAGAAT